MGYREDFKPSFKQDNVINIEPHEIEEFIDSNLWRNIEQWLHDRRDIFNRAMLDSDNIHETKLYQGMILEDEILFELPCTSGATLCSFWIILDNFGTRNDYLVTIFLRRTGLFVTI